MNMDNVDQLWPLIWPSMTKILFRVMWKLSYISRELLWPAKLPAKEVSWIELEIMCGPQKMRLNPFPDFDSVHFSSKLCTSANFCFFSCIFPCGVKIALSVCLVLSISVEPVGLTCKVRWRPLMIWGLDRRKSRKNIGGPSPGKINFERHSPGKNKFWEALSRENIF